MKPFRNFGKAVLKRALYATSRGVERRFRAANGRSAIILQYHSVSPADGRSFEYIHPSLSVSLDAFDRQMAFLRSRFEVVSLDALLAHVHGDRPLSGMPVTITFDDGYRDNYLYAFPVLLKYGLPAMFYLTTDCVDKGKPLWTSELRSLILHSRKPSIQIDSLESSFSLEDLECRIAAIQHIKSKMIPMGKAEREKTLAEIRKYSGVTSTARQRLADVMMNWQEVLEMRRYGMDFGAHTISHPSLPHIPRQEAQEEALYSKQALERMLSEPITHFSYPNPGDKNHCSADTAHMIKAVGYVSAVTSISGYVLRGDDNLRLKRKGIYNAFSKLPDFYLWLRKEAVGEAFGLL